MISVPWYLILVLVIFVFGCGWMAGFAACLMLDRDR